VGDVDVRQAAIDEKRLWVRITRACNNRCEFCLDSGALGGGPIPDDEVRAKLLRGRDEGYTRLILSGGEATTHPHFLDFVKYGTEIGYSWIQVISNGRMFAYENFARQAVENGLREATLSLHAHNEDLFEKLTGARGAFKQAIRGLVNLKRLGTVVSVDIVLTRLNLPHLREIMEFYMQLGVMEFDLLHLIPFGRGFDENREVLYADEEMLGRELARALELDRVPGMFIWTNRLPIRFLEGHEHLFQDPHKLYDEVLGERQSFRRLFADGTMPECMQPERCAACFLQGFCDAAVRYAAGRWDPAACRGELHSPFRVGDGDRTRDRDGDRVRDGDEGAAHDAVELDAAMARRIMADGGGGLATLVPGAIKIATREHYGEARAVAPSVDEVRAVAKRLGRPVLDLPRCLGGAGYTPRDAAGQGTGSNATDACGRQGWWPAPPPEILDERGIPDVAKFVGFFIERLYRVKSLRCAGCPENDNCPGLQVNLARHWGLKVLDRAAIDGNGPDKDC